MSTGGDEPSRPATGSAEPAEVPKDAVTIIPKRLYFVPAWDGPLPSDSPGIHFFCTDDTLVYEPFFADFGPLNLSCVCKYARMLDKKLAAAAKQNRIVVHYVCDDPEKRANAVFLMGAAQQLLLGRSAQEAFRPFRSLLPRLASFRDASYAPCSFKLSVLDCLEGLEMAINLGWFNYKTFDVEAYDFYEKIENGNLNWIIPKKFIAFSCPSAASSSSSVVKGQRDLSSGCTPEYYVQLFKRFGVKLVVCLSNRLYDSKKFTKRNIDHADLFFVDGTCPSREIIETFFRLVENRAHPIAVHCKAGLGRTGTLIGCFAIKHYRFRAAAWIGWNRLCRPGSVLGPQQKFLSDIQDDLMKMSIAENIVRTKPLSQALNNVAAQLQDDISECLAKLSLEERRIAEYGDAGQGGRLIMAKRQQQAAALFSESASSTAVLTVGSGPSSRSAKTILALPAFVPQTVAAAAPPFRSLRIGKSGIVVSTLTGPSKRAIAGANANPAAPASTVTRKQVSTK